MKLKQERIPALDATRGLAILLMVLSGVIPYGALPAWMYHAQIPPPNHVFDPTLAGFTWVDLVFPLFIFCMGVAIPIALKHKSWRIKTGQYIFKRTFLLASFAILLQHLRPHQITNPPDVQSWWIALLGFVLLFLCFSTYPGLANKWFKKGLRAAASMLLIALAFTLTYKNGEGFSLWRSDIILIVLTNVYFFASLIYLFTKQNHYRKIMIALILLGIRIVTIKTDWLQFIDTITYTSWLFQVKYLQYLFIAIPGVVLGEMMLQKNPQNHELAQKKSWLLSLICLTLTILIIAGLQSRILWPLALVVIAVNGVVLYYLLKLQAEALLTKVYLMASVLLLIGFVAEPFEGGIKKDPSTFSYYFITAGLASYVFIVFLNIKPRFYERISLKVLVNNGKNPMIAYVAFANLLWPILALTGLELYLIEITQSPWLGFMRGCFYTLFIALLVSFFSRHKYYWKT